MLSCALQPQPLIALLPDTDPDDPDKKRLTCLFLPQRGQQSPSLGMSTSYYGSICMCPFCCDLVISGVVFIKKQQNIRETCCVYQETTKYQGNLAMP